MVVTHRISAALATSGGWFDNTALPLAARQPRRTRYIQEDISMTQTILVVDDETKLRDMIRVYLEQEGYRVVEAGHGREALYVARYEKPDLIVLDVMMPEMGGYEFLRAFSKEAETPVIILTARV